MNAYGLQDIPHQLLRVLELQEGGQALVFQQGDVAALGYDGAQAGVAEEVQEPEGVGDAAVVQLVVEEGLAGGLVLGAAEGYKSG